MMQKIEIDAIVFSKVMCDLLFGFVVSVPVVIKDSVRQQTDQLYSAFCSLRNIANDLVESSAVSICIDNKCESDNRNPTYDDPKDN